MSQQSLPIFQINEQNLVYIVLDEDPILHTDEHPLCADLTCPCHDDRDLVRQYINKPLDNGLLTGSEAIRLYFGRMV